MSLTKQQEEILQNLTNEFLATHQILNRVAERLLASVEMVDRTRQQVYDGNINWNNWRDELRLIIQNIHERMAVISKDITDLTSLVNAGKSAGKDDETTQQIKLLKAFDGSKTITKAFLLLGLILLVASGWIHSCATRFVGDSEKRVEHRRSTAKELPASPPAETPTQ